MDEKENSVKCKYQFLSGNFTVVISFIILQPISVARQ